MLRADHKLLVFTDNGTIYDPTDDISKMLTNATGNGVLPGNKIYSIAQDLDGELWLGSDEGIGVIYSPGNVFTGGNYDAQRILVEVGGHTQYLLESETVTAIVVDGDNRKWIGTEQAGVFLFSADGTEEIHHFTEENSQLYSNLIVDIQINGETGGVFFGTDKGILSYKNYPFAINDPSVSPNSFNINFSPNPFSEKTTVKFNNSEHSSYTLSIFNISGNKVFEMDNIKSDKIEFERGHLPRGVYLVELRGEKVFRGKMIIK